ncbi:Hypothetical protein CINCED_3A019262 [Cinara cedri]|uniref:Uncharacterized protein n=1 Tax=Cinara cedri TaxID=506608 RepID=A0A5E4M5T5_9HEMI|nr:Hypothetical protein CINCED_3A019262 [Cinara cedri]
MDTPDDVNTLKILFEEGDDDDVLLLYLSEEERKGRDQLFTKRSTEATMDTPDDVNTLKILFEEGDDDDVLLLYLSEEERKGRDQLFTKRSTEGYYEILINGHLKNNEIEFREFFRTNRNQKPITSSSTLLNSVVGALIVERHDQRQPAVKHK